MRRSPVNTIGSGDGVVVVVTVGRAIMRRSPVRTIGRGDSVVDTARASVGRRARRRGCGRARGRGSQDRSSRVILVGLLALLEAASGLGSRRSRRWWRGASKLLTRRLVVTGQARRTRSRREVGRQARGSAIGSPRGRREANGHNGGRASDGRHRALRLLALNWQGHGRAQQAQDEGSSLRLHCESCVESCVESCTENVAKSKTEDFREDVLVVIRVARTKNKEMLRLVYTERKDRHTGFP